MEITKTNYKDEILDYFNHVWAGLSSVGKDEDGELEWVGKNHNWTAYTWLTDGVDKENIDEYLTQ